MTKAVECPICGRTKVLQKPGKRFNCCGMRHSVQENLVSSPRKEGKAERGTKIPLTNREELKKLIRDVMKEVEQENPAEKLEIEGSPMNEKPPKRALTKKEIIDELKKDKSSTKKKKKKKYECPVCGYTQSKKFSGCPNCYSDITW